MSTICSPTHKGIGEKLQGNKRPFVEASNISVKWTSIALNMKVLKHIQTYINGAELEKRAWVKSLVFDSNHNV